MEKVFYNPKVDWWIPALVVVTVSLCFIGPIIDGDAFISGVIIGAFLLVFEVAILCSVKYQICGDKIGVRNIFYQWDWFPIDKISEISECKSILSSAALSVNRIAIQFSERKILKSSMPLEISPKDREDFITKLKEINPKISLKLNYA